MIFEEEALTIPKVKNCLIYFLLKNDEVVYVGQTKSGLYRPLSHIYSKDFDTIKIIETNEKDLDLLEDEFIKKYKPLYNKQVNYAKNYGLEKVRNNVRSLTNNKNYSLRDLRKLLKKLEIEIVIFNDKETISYDDFTKVKNYIGKGCLC